MNSQSTIKSEQSIGNVRNYSLIRVFGCFFSGSKTNPVLKKNCDLLDVPNEYFDPSCIESRVIKPY